MPKQTLNLFKLHEAAPAGGTGRMFIKGNAEDTICNSPLADSHLLSLAQASTEQADIIAHAAQEAFLIWRNVPAPKRAQVIKTIAKHIQKNSDSLARLMTVEMGKPFWEAKAEVAGVINTANYAASLFHTIGGGQFPSGRENVELSEKWHPLGPVLVVTAFNFPYALWAWNAFIALICGNSVVWKPAPQTPLCAIAIQQVIAEALKEHPEAPEGLLSYIIGSNDDVAIPLVNNPIFPLVSATGSTPMGLAVNKAVSARLGRTILELGGNGAALFTPSANKEQALRLAFFSATLNSGQRCTALRRLLVHESLFTEITNRLNNAFNSWPVGDVYQEGHRLSTLVDEAAAQRFNTKIESLRKDNVELFTSNVELPNEGHYVHPCLALLDKDAPQPQEETFGPLLYIQPYSSLDEAIEKHNAVPQGLSAGIFSNDLNEVHRFTSVGGGESGVTMINDNTGGPEVMVAFGGIKNSGIGSEKGSDSWKQYMRRQSIMTNYQNNQPSDMGINFK